MQISDQRKSVFSDFSNNFLPRKSIDVKTYEYIDYPIKILAQSYANIVNLSTLYVFIFLNFNPGLKCAKIELKEYR